jgi:DNA-binding PadR family transcriptional regulator
MRREVEERTDGTVLLSAGTLYEALQRLERLGLIVGTKPPAGAEVESKRWRFYRITPYGKKVLKAELRRLEMDVSYGHAKGLVGS